MSGEAFAFRGIPERLRGLILWFSLPDVVEGECSESRQMIGPRPADVLMSAFTEQEVTESSYVFPNGDRYGG